MIDCGLDMTFLPYFRPFSESLGPYHNQDIRTKHNISLGEQASGNYQTLLDSQYMFLPPHAKLFDGVDAVVVTNPFDMLGIVFINREREFRGTIYATSPCFEFGRLMVLELVEYLKRSKQLGLQVETRAREFARELGLDNLDFQPMVDEEEAHKVFSQFKTVSFGEVVNLFQGRLRLTFLSSGHSLGSANVILQFPSLSLFYIGRTSSQSSHARQLDTTIGHVDCVVVGTHVGEDYNQAEEICDKVAAATSSGKSVILPCHPYGPIFDVIECLAERLREVRMYVVSPVARSVFSHCDIFCEWLSPRKSSSIFDSRHPFRFQELIDNGILTLFENCYDDFANSLRLPCVVFCGHVSGSFGDVVHLLEYFCGDSCVLITDRLTPREGGQELIDMTNYIGSSQLSTFISSMSPANILCLKKETHKQLGQYGLNADFLDTLESFHLKVDYKIPAQLHFDLARLCRREMNEEFKICSAFVETCHNNPIYTFKESEDCEGSVFLDQVFGRESVARSLRLRGFQVEESGDKFTLVDGPMSEFVFDGSSLVITSTSCDRLLKFADMFFWD